MDLNIHDNLIYHITALAERGGCEKNCFLFCRDNPQDHHTIIVLGKKGPMVEDWNQIDCEVVCLDILDHNLLLFWNKLHGYLNNRNHFQNIILWTGGRLPFILGSLPGNKSKVAIYVGNPWSLDNMTSWLWSLSGMFLRFSDNLQFFPCSYHVDRSLSELPSPYNIIPRKVSYNPVPKLYINPYKDYEKGIFKLGMVARLDPIKDHATAIKGFALFNKNQPNSEFHLVGDGILRDELKKLVDDLMLSKKIIFHGEQDNVYGFLMKWHVFVYSTTEKEGMGSVVPEAMANGLPLVLNDIPLMKEVAGDSENALWFKTKDPESLAEKLMELYDSEEIRCDLSEKSYDRAGFFSTANFSKPYLDFFNEG